MGVLYNRTVPQGIVENISTTNYPEACRLLLLAALRPSRRGKLYRVIYQGRPLWLKANRTAFKTRTSARNAVVNWLYNGMAESLIAQNQAEGRPSWEVSRTLRDRVLGTNSNLPGPMSSVPDLLEQHVQRLFADGTLRIETMDLDRVDLPAEEEGIAS